MNRRVGSPVPALCADFRSKLDVVRAIERRALFPRPFIARFRRRAFGRAAASLCFLCALPLLAQSNRGELRLTVTDVAGRGVKTAVRIQSQANQYRATLQTDSRGDLDLQRLPYGVYRLDIDEPGFAPVSQAFSIRSTFPVSQAIQLNLPTVRQTVTVTGVSTLIDPEQAGSVNEIGSSFIAHRLASISGRSLQDLVNSQPGWLYEGNAVLHPRGSEYQTQFVIDGIPFTDNFSPGFGNEIEADDVQSMSIYTAGIPAEFGRKMGGVVEVDTLQDLQPGFHGQAVLSGGSFGTGDAFVKGQYTRGKNTLGGSASGSMTDHYLNPVVPQNFTNTGTLGDFSADYEFDPTPKDRLRLTARHELARYDIPNEQVQENPQLRTELGQPAPPPGTAPQRQTAGNFETLGIASYRHIFSPDFLIEVRDMARASSNDFASNPSSWPIVVAQNNNFTEEYFNFTAALERGPSDWKAGLESDNKSLHENYRDLITADPAYPNYPFDPNTASAFAFTGSRPDLEQAAFIQDLIHIGRWTVSAGLRWDHYQLLLNQNAFSPRFSAARYFPAAHLIAHVSYDRVFQTPSFENILLSNSPQVESFEPTVLRLPVEPSRGDYYEIGASKSFVKQLRVDANMFRRDSSNYANDDQILNTGVSFPIAFRKAVIYGAEGKLEVPDWRGFSGFLSYSYQVGNAWFPVTGGLFLGQDAVDATTQLTGHFPDSQDQRNTVRGRGRYQLTPRLWLAAGAQYNSGLPFDFNGNEQQALAEYGPQVTARINFNRGRIYPAFKANASAGADLYKSDQLDIELQADGENLNDVLDVIDFGGLFSGNAVGPPRSFMLRLTTTF